MDERSDIARRFADLAARANELQARAASIGDDAGDLDDDLHEELDALERQLAELEDEERRLDALDDDGERTVEHERVGGRRVRMRVDLGDGEKEYDEHDVGDLLSDVFDHVRDRIRVHIPGISTTGDVVDRQVSHTGGVVEIDNQKGAIRVVPGLDGEVRVVAELRAPSDDALAQMMVDIVGDATGTHICTKWPGGGLRRNAALEVHVPPGTEVRARTGSGSIRIRDTAGPARASTTGGSIRVRGAKGDVDVATTGGSLRVTAHDGAVDAKTTGGSIRVDGHLTGHVKVKTSGGSIGIDGVDRAEVRARTSGGTIKVAGHPVGDSDIRTSGGSIRVALAPAARLHVDARGSSVRSDFRDLVGDRSRVTGTLGDGRDGDMRVKTSGGSVHIERRN